MCTIDEGKDKDVASSWSGIKNQTPDEDLPVSSTEEPVVLGLEGSKKEKRKFQVPLQLVSKCNCNTPFPQM